MKTYKILGALLTYPEPALIGALGEMSRLLDRENALPARERTAVGNLIGVLTVGDLLSLQEQYVGQFDRTRSLSLHLFEHIHGESRDRGQAMVDLLDHYQRHGLEIDAKELPDYLPLFLEFLSAIPEHEAAALLGQVVHIVGAHGARLEKRGSPYAAVFRALGRLAAEDADDRAVQAILAADNDEPSGAKELDAEWEEDPVTFGGAGTAACPQAREILGRMGAPQAPDEPSKPQAVRPPHRSTRMARGTQP